MTPDGVTFGPYADGSSAGGSVQFHGLDGQPLSTVTNLAYYMSYIADATPDTPYMRVMTTDASGAAHDAIFTPSSQSYPGLGPGPLQEWVATQGAWRYDSDAGTGGDPWVTLVGAHGTDTITRVEITLGFTSGTNLAGLLRRMQVNGVDYEFSGPVPGPSTAPAQAPAAPPAGQRGS